MFSLLQLPWWYAPFCKLNTDLLYFLSISTNFSKLLISLSVTETHLLPVPSRKCYCWWRAVNSALIIQIFLISQSPAQTLDLHGNLHGCAFPLIQSDGIIKHNACDFCQPREIRSNWALRQRSFDCVWSSGWFRVDVFYLPPFESLNPPRPPGFCR